MTLPSLHVPVGLTLLCPQGQHGLSLRRRRASIEGATLTFDVAIIVPTRDHKATPTLQSNGRWRGHGEVTVGPPCPRGFRL